MQNRACWFRFRFLDVCFSYVHIWCTHNFWGQFFSSNSVLPQHDYVMFGSLPLQIRQSSVTFGRPANRVETFCNISLSFCTLVINWLAYKILWRSSQGNPSIGGVKHKRGIKIEWCHIRVSHLLTTFLSSSCSSSCMFSSVDFSLVNLQNPLNSTACIN